MNRRGNQKRSHLSPALSPASGGEGDGLALVQGHKS